MAHSFFIIGLGFLLNLKPEIAGQKDAISASLIPALGQLLQNYLFTGMQLLVCFLVLYVVFRKWHMRYTGKLY
ncbi:hypothetical protein Q0590_06110 [Rhodocytophaga aerolata]|uniref:Uncharacterized protein n=1 Tax=Rhodocytophaga aerolata TaxID=455078 RepID=A0ABT8R148_9BACT|nr:hypothetical protein [Rhodocytophaga aerolata]MDO1445815.1 hypothetical protein [Rhodocytophaga aerolata]